MLTIDERLIRMGSFSGRHGLLAAKVLDKVGKEIRRRELGYLDDMNWMFHILMPDGKGRWISLHCGGFSKGIDIQYLRKDGAIDKRFQEKGFMTPKGAVNATIKLIERHRRL